MDSAALHRGIRSLGMGCCAARRVQGKGASQTGRDKAELSGKAGKSCGAILKNGVLHEESVFVALAVRTGISTGNIVSKYFFTGVSAKKIPRCSTQNQRMSNNASNRVEDTNEKGRDTEHTLKIR